MFGFSGAITPGKPNIYLTRPASSGGKADCRAARGFPLAAARYSTTLRARGTPQGHVIPDGSILCLIPSNQADLNESPWQAPLPWGRPRPTATLRQKLRTGQV